MDPIIIYDKEKEEDLERRVRLLEYKQSGLTDEQIARLEAIQDNKKRTEYRQKFNTHLMVYIVVGLILWVAFRGQWWLIFPTLGWGAALFAHWLEVRKNG